MTSTRIIDKKRRVGVEPHCHVVVLSILPHDEKAVIDEFLMLQGVEATTASKSVASLELQLWTTKSRLGHEIRFASGFTNNMANVHSAVAVGTLAREYSPSVIIVCGIAGSMQPADIALGDVVISTDNVWRRVDKISADVKESDKPRTTDGSAYCLRWKDEFGANLHNRWTKEIAQIRPQIENTLPSNNGIMRQRIEDLRCHNFLGGFRRNKVKQGRVLSTDFVLSQPSLRDDFLRQLSMPLAVEMEFAGAELAVRRHCELMETRGSVGIRPQALTVRGICDFAQDKSDTDRYWRDVAATNAAHATLSIIKHFGTNWTEQGQW